jgi:hypothetical protein
VIAAHRVDRDGHSATFGRIAEAGPRRASSRVADLVDHDQEADSVVDCFSSIAWRPLYQPQLGHTWCGSFGS